MDQQTLTRLKVKVKIDPQLYELAHELSQTSGTSLSECIESMVLLVKSICSHSKGDEPVFTMRELKYTTLANAPSLTKLPQKKFCHLTLHPDVVSFATYLHRTYPPVFSSLNDAYELCIRYCCQFCDKGSDSRYLRKRLKDVKKFHARQA